MGVFRKTKKIKPPRNWVPPKFTYAIAAEARTGSNLLLSALSNTKVLGAPTEFFNRSMIQQGFFKQADGSLETQCSIARSTTTEPGGVCGLKIFPGQFDWVASRINLDEWFPDINWIWLRRHDLLGQAISWEFATQSKAWSSRQSLQRQPEYDFRKIGKRLVNASMADARWNHYFAVRNITPLEVWFEDLPQGGLEHVIQQLSLKANVVPAADWKPAINVKRQTDPAKDEWRERFLEDARSDPHPFMRASINPSFQLVRRWLTSKLRAEDLLACARVVN